jgi:hypothetical protein
VSIQHYRQWYGVSRRLGQQHEVELRCRIEQFLQPHRLVEFREPRLLRLFGGGDGHSSPPLGTAGGDVRYGPFDEDWAYGSHAQFGALPD